MPAPHASLTPALLPSAAELLADAFFTNPAHSYICPDPARRRAQLEWLLGGNLRLQPDLGASFCLADGLVVKAMGFWTRSDAAGIGLLAKLRAGLLAAPLRLGAGGVRRLFEVTSAIERHLARSLTDRPYWYLNNMVVRKELRGTGVGSQLLGEQLQLVTGKEPGLAVALSTQRPENVTFYRRLGFGVVWHERIGRGPGAFESWIMRHGAPD